MKTRLFTITIILSAIVAACNSVPTAEATSIPVADTSAAQPTAEIQPTETAPAPQSQIEAENVFTFDEMGIVLGFDYPAGIEQSVNTAYVGNYEPQAPFELPYPPHARVLFTAYSGGMEDSLADGLRVFRVDEVNALEAGVIESVNAVLEEQIDHHTDFPRLAGAGSIIDAQVTPLAFKNGNGYRYLLTKSFSADPLNSTTITYLYQGITSDEKYFVSFILDVDAPFLAEFIGQPLTNSGEFEAYYQNVNASVESAAGDQFTPSLIALDELVSSVIVLEK